MFRSRTSPVISSNPVLACGFQINSCVRDAALASDSPFVRVRVAMALSRAGDNIYAEKLAAHLDADYRHAPSARARFCWTENPSRTVMGPNTELLGSC